MFVVEGVMCRVNVNSENWYISLDWRCKMYKGFIMLFVDWLFVVFKDGLVMDKFGSKLILIEWGWIYIVSWVFVFVMILCSFEFRILVW